VDVDVDNHDPSPQKGMRPGRVRLDRVYFFPDDVPLLAVGLVRVGGDAGLPEPPLALADMPALSRLAFLGFPDPGALDRAFPSRT
jgi:hypothetical protein